MPDATNDPSQNLNQNNASLEALVRENLELTRQIYALTEKTRRYIFYGEIMSVVKIILVVGPLILGALYLGPLLKQTLDTYANLLGPAGSDGTSASAPVNPSSLLEPQP